MDPKQAIWIWDLSTSKPIKQLSEAGKGGAQTLQFTQDGRSVLTNIRPYLIDIETKEAFSFVSPGDKKTQVKIEPSGGDRATISLGTMQDDDAIVHRAVTSRTGALAALGRGWHLQPSFVDVWDLSSKRRVGRLKPDDARTLSSFSFDNTLIAIEGGTQVSLWQLPKGKKDRFS